MQNYVDMIQV